MIWAAACSRSACRAPGIARLFWRAGATIGSISICAKQDRANIEDDELKAFRELAKCYAALTEEQVTALVAGKDWIEICKNEDFGKPGDR